MTTTVLYLVRHGATDANLAQPPVLLGRRLDPPLATIGIRQAEAARQVLATLLLDQCLASPLRRAVQTAAILAAPHGLSVKLLDAVTECDLGLWEGMDWPTIRATEADAYGRFMADPVRFSHPQGESYGDVHSRVACALGSLCSNYPGQTILVVTHQVVLRTYLGGLLGYPSQRIRELVIPNAAISVVEHNGQAARVRMLADTTHLRDVPGSP